MGLKRNVGLATALRYKGQGPMLTFVLHRIGGLGMGIFVTVHILASFVGALVGVYVMVRKGRDAQFALPFGTFLAPAAFVAMLWGDRLVQIYKDYLSSRLG